MEDRLFLALVKNEPTVEELTRKDYEKRMALRRTGQKGEAGKDGQQPVGPDTAEEQDAASVRVEGESPQTRADYIKILCQRGLDYKTLKRKKLGELKDMY